MWNINKSSGIVGDHFTDLTIASRERFGQLPPLIGQYNAQTIQF